MTRPGNFTSQAGFEPRIFHSRGGRLNHKANEAVTILARKNTKMNSGMKTGIPEDEDRNLGQYEHDHADWNFGQDEHEKQDRNLSDEENVDDRNCDDGEHDDEDEYW